MNSTPHTEDTMQSILENMEAVIARQESLHSDLEEATKLDGILADIQTVNSKNYLYVREFLGFHIYNILARYSDLGEEDGADPEDLVNKLVNAMFPCLSVTTKAREDQLAYSEFYVTFKNVHQPIREVLANYGLVFAKNPETNDDIVRNDLLKIVLTRLSWIEIYADDRDQSESDGSESDDEDA
jgi:hypothetical protein